MILFIGFLVLTVFPLVYFILFRLLRTGWDRISHYDAPEASPTQSVSIVIAARNEADRITPLLESLLQQNYPVDQLEVILVNDHSTDQTAAVVQQVLGVAPFSWKLINPDEHSFVGSGKKAALRAGIAAAKGEWIVTTDADVQPGTKWIYTLMSYAHDHQPKMILGPVEVSSNNAFESLQAIEMLGLMGATAGSAAWKRPLLANGANLAFSKQAYEEVGGIPKEPAVASGDDVFLMLAFNRAYNGAVHFIKSQEALVSTPAAPDLRSLLNQRIRWASKSKSYGDRHLLISGTILAANYCGLLFFLIISLLKPTNIPLFFMLLVFKTFSDLILVKSVTNFFERSKLLVFLLPLQLVYPIYALVVAVLGLKGSYDWKGRTVR